MERGRQGCQRFWWRFEPARVHLEQARASYEAMSNTDPHDRLRATFALVELLWNTPGGDGRERALELAEHVETGYAELGEWCLFEVQRLDGDRVIVTGRLEEGDSVVIAGQTALADGDRVEIGR